MCGRFYQTYSSEELIVRYSAHSPLNPPQVQRNSNFCPSQFGPVLYQDQNLALPTWGWFRWGLIPSWSREEKIGFQMINARSETVSEKPSFRQAFQKRRCVIPVNGFYEWKRSGSKKTPIAISLKDDPIMSLAGIWEAWRSPDGRTLETFSILTTSANSSLSPIHDRMPVILNPSDEKTWLGNLSTHRTAIQALLKPCPSSWIRTQEVDPSTLKRLPKHPGTQEDT
ncbi:MAG: SOS response-associated peptidase [Bdellovibrionia bacterium]